MRDPRDEQYASILVETCIDVQPGWQVIVLASPLGRPLFGGGLPRDRAPRRVRAPEAAVPDRRGPVRMDQGSIRRSCSRSSRRSRSTPA